ncbi:Cdc37 N terminal kinase binding-domain-containing protein [Lipomyces japonicus]|uniref:Cdc37 N terminal kinase binding-domain-containing protein n=1 Tax=Lipomyces japonicus TaxID=56871 RepID=UPI0034CDA435
MVVDYSKWDKLELSDDSDIEVHPNVDKKSFIRWKQRDIHEKRDQRRHEIETLKAENLMNSNLIKRIDRVIELLLAVPVGTSNEKDAIKKILDDASKDAPGTDELRPPGSGNRGPTYGEMIKSLIDQVVSEVGQAKPYADALKRKFQQHYDKLTELQDECVKKLTQLQNEETKHITSEDIHFGFDSTQISKKTATESTKTTAATTAKKSKEPKIEVINSPASGSADTGADADDEGGDDDEEDFQVSDQAKAFAKIAYGDYDKCLEFIRTHSSIVSEGEADGILYDAFGEEMKGNHKAAKRHVHNALLLQYCARLGPDGVGLFFSKIRSPNAPTLKAFLQDVESTYSHIRQRSVVLAEQQLKDGDVEEEIINLEELSDAELAEYGLTKADIERMKREQAEQDIKEEQHDAVQNI